MPAPTYTEVLASIEGAHNAVKNKPTQYPNATSEKIQLLYLDVLLLANAYMDAMDILRQYVDTRITQDGHRKAIDMCNAYSRRANDGSRGSR